MKFKYYIIGIVLVIIDQLSKILMINKEFIIIPNLLKFSYVENTNGAFGVGTKYIVLLFSIIITIGIIIYLLKENKKINNYIPYILILFGSIGNLIDRIFRGYVIDFININIFNFPTFNLADIAIVLGTSLLIFEIIKINFKIKKQINL